LLEYSRKKESEDRKFLAAVNGVEMEDDEKATEDVTDLLNSNTASQEGFGINEGLGFMQLEE
jgi:hypothetical protein